MAADVRREFLHLGKLPLDDLRSLLARLQPRDPRLVIGPQIGEDAAVIDAGDRYFVVSTDPITLASDRIGWYAVHVNANDVAVMGARPRWFSVVMMLPDAAATRRMAEAIMVDIEGTCAELGITVCGGHTEVTQGLDRPILVGQMLGEVAPPHLVRKDRLQAGDDVLLAGGAAIEGTAILARDRSAWLTGRVPPDLLARAQGFLIDPGISVVSAALAAAETGGVHGMHDPTEGGVVTGLCELVAPSGLGVRVVREQIRVFPETDAICAALTLDPLKLIASGGLLIAVAPASTVNVIGALDARGIPVSAIGHVCPAADGLTMVRNGRVEPLRPADRDEITKAFEPE